MISRRAFVVAEEPRAILANRSPDGAAELIAMKLLRARREEVARIELLIAEELEQLAVEAVAARPCGEIDQTGIRTLVGHEEAHLHFELVDGGGRDVQSRFAQAAAARCDSVDQVTCRTADVAAENDGIVTAAGLASDSIAACGGRDGAPGQERKLKEVPSVERQFLYARAVDDGSDRVRFRLKLWNQSPLLRSLLLIPDRA